MGLLPWDAYMQSMEYSLVGECYTTDEGLAGYMKYYVQRNGRKAVQAYSKFSNKMGLLQNGTTAPKIMQLSTSCGCRGGH